MTSIDESGVKYGISTYLKQRRRFFTDDGWDKMLAKIRTSSTMYVGGLSFHTTEVSPAHNFFLVHGGMECMLYSVAKRATQLIQYERKHAFEGHIRGYVLSSATILSLYIHIYCSCVRLRSFFIVPHVNCFPWDPTLCVS